MRCINRTGIQVNSYPSICGPNYFYPFGVTGEIVGDDMEVYYVDFGAEIKLYDTSTQ